MSNETGSPYLEPTFFLDSDHPAVVRFASGQTEGLASSREKAVRLYLAVRDKVRYDPYKIEWARESFKASRVLERGVGYCVTKAVLLTAAARASGIPARLGFADVRNHLTTRALRGLMDTDRFVYHGYTEFLIGSRWVKATCAFPARLCERFGVPPLEFDGEHDALFQPFDGEGRRFMEYVADRGKSADLPFEDIRRTMLEAYPRMYRTPHDGNFEEEAGED